MQDAVPRDLDAMRHVLDGLPHCRTEPDLSRTISYLCWTLPISRSFDACTPTSICVLAIVISSSGKLFADGSWRLVSLCDKN